MKKTKTSKLLALASSMAVALSSMGITSAAVDELDFLDGLDSLDELTVSEEVIDTPTAPPDITTYMESSPYGLLKVKNVFPDGTVRYLGGSSTDAYQAAGTYPSSYNLVSKGAITSVVKDQILSGTCYAHSSAAAAESNMIMQGLATTSIDYSERHLAWFNNGTSNPNTSDPFYGDGLGLGTGISGAYCYGGFNQSAAAMWSSGQGVELESNAPFTSVRLDNDGLPESYRYHSYARVKEMREISVKNRDAIKESLMTNGAMAINYYQDNALFKKTTTGGTALYQTTYGTDKQNHSVTIVGWDDNYSKANFKETPPGNGAWLIKNSYGTSFGDKGYFWMSYYEKSIDTAKSFIMTKADTYSTTYAYDGTVFNFYGWLYTNNYGANIFTAQNNEPITAVSMNLFDVSENSDAIPYTIKIYTDVTSTSNPESGKLAHTQSGKLLYSGYQTVNLSKSVAVTKGQKFSVVIELGKADVYFAIDNYARYYGESFLKPAWGSWWDARSYTQTVTYEVTDYNFNTYTSSFDINHGVNVGIRAFTSGTASATPAKPTGVTVTPGDKSLTVKWNPVAGATKYYIYTYLNGKYTTVRTNYTGTSYTITGLTNGTKYGVLVRAFNDANVGSAFTTNDLVVGTPTAAAAGVAKPTGVTVTPGDKTLTVKWNPVAGATKYYIYTYLNGQYSLVRANYTNTAYAITGLTNGVKYGVLVRAFNDANVGSAFTTNDLVVGTPTAAAATTVAKPTGVTVTPGDKTLTVKWNPVAGATKYYIYTYLNGQYSLVRANYTNTAYAITGLTNGVKYGVLVRAFNNANVGSAFTTNDLVTGTPAAPAATTVAKPTGVTVTPGDKTLTVKWNPVAGATKYYIYTYLNGQYTLVRANYTNTAYAITGLTNGVKYGVLVRAFNNANVGSAFTTNDLVVGTPVASAATTVAKPTGVTVTPGDKTLTVKWNPVAGATKYYIYTYLNGQYTLVRANYTNTAYAITGLTNGVRYGVLVRAFNDANVGSAFTTNDLVVGTPVAAAAPAKPTGVTAYTGDGCIRLTWNHVSGATSYKVYLSNGSTLTEKVTTTSNTATVQNLTNGTYYNFIVRAFNASGVGSDWTSSDAVMKCPRHMNTPTIAFKPFVNDGDTERTVTWSNVSYATTYRIVYGCSSQFFQDVINISSTDTAFNYKITGLKSGCEYYFYIIAICDDAESAASNQITYTVPGIPPVVFPT